MTTTRSGAAPAAVPFRLWWSAAIAAAVVAIDQVTKSVAVEHLSGRAVEVFWTLRLALSFNSGLAFSQGRGLTRYITVAGVLLVVGLLWWSRGITRSVTAVAVALLVGGAGGNLTDRIFRGNDGAVIDFIDFGWWPVFNVADIAISCGAVLLVLATLRDPEQEENET